MTPPAVTQDGAAGRVAIRVQGLTKRFGRRVAVDGASFVVPAGTVTGFVGPNGAGKTTTLRMLVGLSRPTSGAAEVLGHSIASPSVYLGRVGALIEEPAFYPGLSGWRNLEVLTTLGRYDPARIGVVLDVVDLADRAGDLFRTYSRGMKQRLGIAAALLREPEVLILDEPTNGLDPSGIHDMRELVARITQSGLTVLVSSHLLAEVQSVCDWLVIIDRGRLAYQGTIDALLEQGSEGLIVATADPHDLEQVAVLVAAACYHAEPDNNRLRIQAPPAFAAELSRACMEHHIVLTELTPTRVSLEQRFLELTRAHQTGDDQ
jgi:ABC-2 type transport system ATP-binding protein